MSILEDFQRLQTSFEGAGYACGPHEGPTPGFTTELKTVPQNQTTVFELVPDPPGRIAARVSFEEPCKSVHSKEERALVDAVRRELAGVLAKCAEVSGLNVGHSHWNLIKIGGYNDLTVFLRGEKTEMAA